MYRSSSAPEHSDIKYPVLNFGVTLGDLESPSSEFSSGPEAFQTAGSNVRLIRKFKVEKRRCGPNRRRTSNSGSSSAPATTCPAASSAQETTAARKWIPFAFRRRQRRRRRDPRGEGQSNSIEGQVQGHVGEHVGDDLEMTLSVDQRRCLDVDLLRNDTASSTTVGR